MPDGRVALLIVLLLAAPAVLLLVGAIVATIVGRSTRLRCPACLQRGLRQTSVVRATSVVGGESAPDYRSYFRCEHCGSRFKKHDGILTGVPQDEIADATRFEPQTEVQPPMNADERR